MWFRVRRISHTGENYNFRFGPFVLSSPFPVRVVDGWGCGTKREPASPRYIPQRFHRARGFGLQVDGVYKFVAIRVQAPTYAVTPTPISTIVILPTVELSGMVGRHGDVALIYGNFNRGSSVRQVGSPYKILDAV